MGLTALFGDFTHANSGPPEWGQRRIWQIAIGLLCIERKEFAHYFFRGSMR